MMPPMPLVTLVLANGPGFPQGSADHRYEISVLLTQGGYLDPDAWLADPAPWPAVRFRPDGPPQSGTVQWNEDTGWSLAFSPAEGEAADAAPHVVIGQARQLRPGEYVTIRESNGRDYGFRVVGVG